MTSLLARIAQEFESLGMPFEVRKHSIERTEGAIIMWINEVAPTARDRGNWSFTAISNDPTLVSIDGADAFPRYYFRRECLIKEVSAWIELRRLST